MYISSECTQLLSLDDEFCTRSQYDSNENRTKLTREGEKTNTKQGNGRPFKQTLWNKCIKFHYFPSKAFNSTAAAAAAMAHLFAQKIKYL